MTNDVKTPEEIEDSEGGVVYSILCILFIFGLVAAIIIGSGAMKPRELISKPVNLIKSVISKFESFEIKEGDTLYFAKKYSHKSLKSKLGKCYPIELNKDTFTRWNKHIKELRIRNSYSDKMLKGFEDNSLYMSYIDITRGTKGDLVEGFVITKSKFLCNKFKPVLKDNISKISIGWDKRVK